MVTIEKLRTPAQPNMSWTQTLTLKLNFTLSTRLRSPHLILDGQHHTNSLKSEYRGAKEDGELVRAREPGHGGGVRERRLEDVVKDDAETHELEDVGKHGAG